MTPDDMLTTTDPLGARQARAISGVTVIGGVVVPVSRAEIDAQTRRYEIDHPAYRPPAETPQGSGRSGVWMVAAAVVALLGVAALVTRKAA